MQRATGPARIAGGLRFRFPAEAGLAGSIYEKPVVWVNGSAAPTGAADAHESLRKVLGYVHATIIEAACAHIPVTRDRLGDDGLIAEPSIRTQTRHVLTTLVGSPTPPGTT